VDRGPACGRRNGFTYRGRWRGAAVNFLVVYTPYMSSRLRPQAPQAVGVS
jgi:hypothetical protein